MICVKIIGKITNNKMCNKTMKKSKNKNKNYY